MTNDYGRILQLTGDARDIGSQLKEKFQDTLIEECDKRKLPDPIEVSEFKEVIVEIAPWWLDEAKIFAGDYLDRYLAANYQPISSTSGDCTSVLATGDAASNQTALMLKNRDTLVCPEFVARRQITGQPVVLTGTDVTNLGAAYFINSHGLAGLNNSGGALKYSAESLGLDGCLVLRYIGETARCCDEALERIENLAERKLLNDCSGKGMIFMFSDTRGKGVYIECSRTTLAYKYIQDDLIVATNTFQLPAMSSESDPANDFEGSSARCERAKDVLREQLTVSVEDLISLARDKIGNAPVCRDNLAEEDRTISSWVYALRPDESVAWICNTAPTHGDFVPIKLS